MEQVINDYISYNNLKNNIYYELELRYKNISESTWLCLLKHFNETDYEKKRKLTLNGVNINKKETEIRELTFTPKNKKFDVKEECRVKTNLRIFHSNQDDNIEYSLNLSSEKPTQCDITLMNNSMIRRKIRFSFIDNSTNKNIIRSIDFTFVVLDTKKSLQSKNPFEFNSEISIENIEEIIKTIKNDNLNYRFEIEIEFLKDNGDNNINIIDDFIQIIKLSNEEIISMLDVLEIYNLKHKQYINKINKILNTKGNILKEILPNVKPFNKQNYSKIYPPINLFITDKADGVRSVLFFENEKSYIMNDNNVFIDLQIPNNFNAIFDCEFIINNDLIENINISKANFKVLIFDILYYSEKNNVNLLNFESRLDTLRKIKFPSDKIKVKEFEKLDHPENYIDIIPKFANTKREYNNDGLIFVLDGDDYQNTLNFKWKPLNKNTIDFYYLDGELFVGIQKNVFINYNLSYDLLLNKDDILTNNYFPVRFSPSINPEIYKKEISNIKEYTKQKIDLNNSVIEMLFEPSTNKWSIVKIRTDRHNYGNDFKVAENVLMNIYNPITIECLINPFDGIGYFKNDKKSIHSKQTAFNSSVKDAYIKQYCTNVNYVIDFGCGKGQDLGRYFNYKVTNYIGIDSDINALSELVSRKQTIIKKFPRTKTNVKLYNRSLEDFGKLDINISNIINGTETNAGLNNIVIGVFHFSIHYFIKTVDNLISLIEYCKKNNINKLLISMLNGAKIFDLLKGLKVSETYDFYNNENILVNSIKKLYNEDNFDKAYSLKIALTLPFTNGEFIEEEIYNISTICNIFEQYGCEIVENKNFEEFNKLKNMTDADIKYTNLYNYLVINVNY